MKVMNKMENLTEKVKQLIEYEKSVNPDIQFLNASHSTLINQIISTYDLPVNCKSSKPSAKMIFLGAPTGAGKDTLVRKIMADNPETNFVVLNMDMFRPYHNEILGVNESILDKDYALKTNQTSYELYYIIQELILREFPGTSVIVTGTMRDLNWVKAIVTRYRNAETTDYHTSLITLAVPSIESAFSIFERYLSMVDSRDENSHTPLRYTSLEYHNDTVKRFASTVHTFEDDFHSSSTTRLFNSIKVYRRNTNILDLSEDTLLYDSDRPNNNQCAFAYIHQIMNSTLTIDPNRISQLLDIIERNSSYLKAQGLYESILTDLKKILAQLKKPFDDITK